MRPACSLSDGVSVAPGATGCHWLGPGPTTALLHPDWFTVPSCCAAHCATWPQPHCCSSRLLCRALLRHTAALLRPGIGGGGSFRWS